MGNVSSNSCPRGGDPITDLNSDIAGYGVVLSFSIATAATMVLTATVVLYDVLAPWDRSEKGLRNKVSDFLLTLSDTQIVTSYALLVAAEKTKCDTSFYTYTLVSDQIFLAIVTHVFSLVIYHKKFYEQRVGDYLAVHGIVRVIFIVGIWIWYLSWVSRGITYPSSRNAPNILYPIGSATSGTNSRQVAMLTVTIVFFLLTIFSMSMKIRRKVDRWKLCGVPIGYILRLLIQGCLPAAFASYFLWDLWQQRSIFFKGEDNIAWDFGQVVPVVLTLLTPVLTIVEGIGEPIGEKFYRAHSRRPPKPNILMYDPHERPLPDIPSNDPDNYALMQTSYGGSHA